MSVPSIYSPLCRRGRRCASTPDEGASIVLPLKPLQALLLSWRWWWWNQCAFSLPSNQPGYLSLFFRPGMDDIHQPRHAIWALHHDCYSLSSADWTFFFFFTRKISGNKSYILESSSCWMELVIISSLSLWGDESIPRRKNKDKRVHSEQNPWLAIRRTMHAARALALTLRKRSNTYKKYSSSRKTKPTFFVHVHLYFVPFISVLYRKRAALYLKSTPAERRWSGSFSFFQIGLSSILVFLCVRPWCYNNTQRREWLRLRQQRFTPVGQLNRPWWYNSYTFCRPLDFRHDGSSMTSWEELIVLPKPNSSPSIW